MSLPVPWICAFSCNFKFSWCEPNSLLILNALLWGSCKTKTAHARTHSSLWIRPNLQPSDCGVPFFSVQRGSLCGGSRSRESRVLLSQIEGSPKIWVARKWERICTLCDTYMWQGHGDQCHRVYGCLPRGNGVAWPSDVWHVWKSLLNKHFFLCSLAHRVHLLNSHTHGYVPPF